MVAGFGLRSLVALALFLGVGLTPFDVARAQTSEPARRDPVITGVAAVLVDFSDGTVLWEKNSRQRRPPASTTKIVTALLVLERSKPGDIVTISSRSEAVGANEAGPVELELVAGEQVSVTDLLYGLMLESANDAAIALAEHVAGSESRFADLMNEKVQGLGTVDSHFVNAHGLDESGHYSTAADLIAIGREAMKLPRFREIVGTTSYLFPGFGARPPKRIENRNRLLVEYEGANGIKTGFTGPAGRAVVASAGRGDESRLAVVLGSPTDAQADARILLDYGFNQFQRRKLLETGKPWGHMTNGDGSTFLVVPVGPLELLVPTETGARTVLDPRGARLIVTPSPYANYEIDVLLKCVSDCKGKRMRGTGFLLNVWKFLAPVAGFLAPE
jgi:D-alanyl-D-alanine carboxypeptidase (penicillin-binding protein 5/6)